MRFICQEYCTDYTSYSFGYRNWAIAEAGDALDPIYDKGYLPYSADLTETSKFYMARSLRVRLGDFTPSSENRRILRKFDDSVTARLYPLADFSDANFENFCLDYFTREHGPGVMPLERLRHILNMGLVTHVMRYADAAGETLGYVLLVTGASFSHYWFSFYAERMARQSFGMYMMLDCARRAQDNSQAHYYLGTAYGTSGRYKLNFPAADYWRGDRWSDDLAQLKDLLAADTTAKNTAAGQLAS